MAKTGSTRRAAGGRGGKSARTRRAAPASEPAASAPAPAPPAESEPPGLVDLRRRALEILERQRAGRKISAAERATLERYRAAMRERERIAALRAVPQAVLCELLGGTPRKTISEWEAAGMPNAGFAGRVKLYDLFAVLPWLRRRWTQPANGEQMSELKRAQTERAKKQTEKLDYELRLARGEYLRKSDVLAQNVARVQAVRTGLMALVEPIADELPNCPDAAAVRVMLEERFRELLMVFAGEGAGTES